MESWLCLLIPPSSHVHCCDIPFRGESRAGDTRLGHSSRRPPALACGRPARVRREEAILSCDLRAGIRVPPAPRPKQTRSKRITCSYQVMRKRYLPRPSEIPYHHLDFARIAFI